METQLALIPDEELMRRLDELVLGGRRHMRSLLRHLGEFDARRLAILKCGAPSTYHYCVTRLGFSEDEACRRIQSARLSRKWPLILDLLEKGDITMSAVTTLSPHLTKENYRQLLMKAKGRSRFDLLRLVAEINPKPDSPDVVRRIAASAPVSLGELFETRPANGSPIPGQPASPREDQPAEKDLRRREQSLIPTAPERIRFSFTGSEKLLALLRRAQDILRHKFPAGDLELVFAEALEALLDRRDPERRLRAKEERRAETGRPAPEPPESWDSRRVPQSIKDEVWRRDGGQCVYRDPEGERCPERGGLEFDHIVPFALGGPSNNAKNIRLLCKAHNRSLAARTFGDFSVWRWRVRPGKPESSGLSAS